MCFIYRNLALMTEIGNPSRNFSFTRADPNFNQHQVVFRGINLIRVLNRLNMGRLSPTFRSYFPFFTLSAIYVPAVLVPAEPPISFVTMPSPMLLSMARRTAAASCLPNLAVVQEE